jgi:uncharacterized membrane protein
MKSRVEIKALAKEQFKAQRGTGILIVLLLVVIGAVCGGASVIVVGGIAGIFVIPVIIIGANYSFIKIYNGEKTELSDLFSKFNDKFLRCVGGYWWMALFTWLWSMCLFVPGIIKGLSYMMTPYIIAEYPNVPAKEALKFSMRMTKGHKGELFVTILSFIGWMMLSGLTFGILLVVHVGPYMQTTWAGYFMELREEAFRTGAITEDELLGAS